jgi:uncharacterized protein YmfQ (DUF2313 family)
MTHAEFLKRLLPPQAYDETGPILNVEWLASGKALDDVQAAVASFMREIDPRTVSTTLEDWERVYGLPDPCFPLGQTFAQRLLALTAKVVDGGGLSRAYYIAQAAALGYPGATIEEFDAGALGETWRFAWRMNLPIATTVVTMTCGSECDDQLRSWGNEVMECVINRIKPAHTLVRFTYLV